MHWLLLLFFLPSAHAGIPLFMLERTTNQNRVIYETAPDPEQPVHPYWEMLAEDGQKEELNSFERQRIYGVKILENGAGSLRFALQALPSFPIEVREQAGSLSAIVKLGAEEWVLKRIFLRVAGGLFPRVDSADLDCEDAAGQRRTHTLLISKDGTWREADGAASSASR